MGLLPSETGLRSREVTRRLQDYAAGGGATAAKRAGSEAVILIGDPPYYGPLGFQPTRPGARRMPGPVDPRRVLAACFETVTADELEGEIRHRDRG